MRSNDRTLVAAFRAGDTDAFDRLYTLYAGRVLRFARRLTGHQTDAEDLTQEAFLAAFRSRESFRGQSQFLTWLLAIVVRRWRDKERHPKPPTVPYLAETLETMHASGEAKDPAQEVIQNTLLHRAIEALDPPLREAFLLVAAESLTHREAADVVGCPVGTMKWRVAEAMRRLRTTLKEAEETEEQNVFPLLV
jgi:RNA polymerase sigma-70 factor, ECF subfamily